MNIEEAREAVKKGTCIDLTCPGCDVSKLEKARVFISGWEAAVKAAAKVAENHIEREHDDCCVVADEILELLSNTEEKS